MTKRWLIGIVLSLCLSLGAAQEAWEYGMYVTQQSATGARESWISNTQVLDVEGDAAALYEALSNTPLPAGQVPFVALLNLLGAQGWQLVTVTQVFEPVAVAQYLFKRQRLD